MSLPRPCIYPTCSRHALPGQSRCPDHLPKTGWGAYLSKHPDRAAFYRSGGWRAARERHILENPTCAVCRRPASHVDHIRPRAEGGAGLDPSNLQSLCAEHHRAKTQAESKFGRKRVAQQRTDPR